MSNGVSFPLLPPCGCSYFSTPTYGADRTANSAIIYNAGSRPASSVVNGVEARRALRFLTLQNTAANNAETREWNAVDMAVYHRAGIAKLRFDCPVTAIYGRKIRGKIPESITGNYSGKMFHCARNSALARFKYPCIRLFVLPE